MYILTMISIMKIIYFFISYLRSEALWSYLSSDYRYFSISNISYTKFKTEGNINNYFPKGEKIIFGYFKLESISTIIVVGYGALGINFNLLILKNGISPKILDNFYFLVGQKILFLRNSMKTAKIVQVCYSIPVNLWF